MFVHQPIQIVCGGNCSKIHSTIYCWCIFFPLFSLLYAAALPTCMLHVCLHSPLPPTPHPLSLRNQLYVCTRSYTCTTTFIFRRKISCIMNVIFCHAYAHALCTCVRTLYVCVRLSNVTTERCFLLALYQHKPLTRWCSWVKVTFGRFVWF